MRPKTLAIRAADITLPFGKVLEGLHDQKVLGFSHLYNGTYRVDDRAQPRIDFSQKRFLPTQRGSSKQMPTANKGAFSTRRSQA